VVARGNHIGIHSLRNPELRMTAICLLLGHVNIFIDMDIRREGVFDYISNT